MKKSLLVAFFVLGIPLGVTVAEHPNVVLVMTDDQGYGELSCHGNPVVATPNLDKLHGQSLRLIDFHVAPMCTPTRGQLMTGMDAARNNAINVSSGHALLRADVPTMANFFKNEGYATGLFGKWHLGDNYPFRPEDRGFEETVWFPSSHIGSVPDFWGNDYFDDTYIRNGKREEFKGYCTDVFFDEAMDFMRRSKKDNKPFFVYLATNTPHGPLYSKDKDRQAIAKVLSQPEFEKMNKGLKNSLSRYLGMVRNIDDNIGRLTAFLEKEELRANTILIFLTDNGTTFGHRYFNAGMRGHKTELWDGGHRVPCFISWPGGDLSKPADVGGLTQVQDLLPTVLELCGVKTSAGKNFDGMSLVPVLRGKEKISPDRMLVINYSRMPIGFEISSPYTQARLTRGGSAVLWKNWRLLQDRSLYNVNDDPGQKSNVYDKHPDVVKKMRAHLDRWWNNVKEKANEPQRIIIGHKKENPAMLTACEWQDVFVDQQGQVRRGVKKNGYWLLEVSQAGTYEFELRRWPREINTAISGKRENQGVALPINSAKFYMSNHHHRGIEQSGAFGFHGLTKQVKADDTSVTFTMQLKKGPAALHAWFTGKDLSVGAYYVYVTKK